MCVQRARSSRSSKPTRKSNWQRNCWRSCGRWVSPARPRRLSRHLSMPPIPPPTLPPQSSPSPQRIDAGTRTRVDSRGQGSKSKFAESLSEARQADNRAIRNSKSPKAESERDDSAPARDVKPRANSGRKHEADDSGNDQSDATPTTSATVDESVSHNSIEVKPQSDAAITPAHVSPEVAQVIPSEAQEDASASIQPAMAIPAAPPTIEPRASVALPSNRSTAPTKAIDPDVDGDHSTDTGQLVPATSSAPSDTLARTETTTAHVYCL